MFGLRTGAEAMHSCPASNVDNGSVRSFAQHYANAADGLKVSVGLATNLNDFIQQMSSRSVGNNAARSGV